VRHAGEDKCMQGFGGKIWGEKPLASLSVERRITWTWSYIGWKIVDWSYLAKRRCNWRALAKRVMEFLGSKKWKKGRGNLLTSWGTISYRRNAAPCCPLILKIQNYIPLNVNLPSPAQENLHPNVMISPQFSGAKCTKIIQFFAMSIGHYVPHFPRNRAFSYRSCRWNYLFKTPDLRNSKSCVPSSYW